MKQKSHIFKDKYEIITTETKPSSQQENLKHQEIKLSEEIGSRLFLVCLLFLFDLLLIFFVVCFFFLKGKSSSMTNSLHAEFSVQHYLESWNQDSLEKFNVLLWCFTYKQKKFQSFLVTRKPKLSMRFYQLLGSLTSHWSALQSFCACRQHGWFPNLTSLV